MLHIRQITLLCFGNRLLKHKITKCSKNLRGWSSRPPGHAYVVGGPVRKFYIKQMFVLVRMQYHNHVDTQDTTSETFRKGYAMYIRYQIWNVASEQE